MNLGVQSFRHESLLQNKDRRENHEVKFGVGAMYCIKTRLEKLRRGRGMEKILQSCHECEKGPC